MLGHENKYWCTLHVQATGIFSLTCYSSEKIQKEMLQKIQEGQEVRFLSKIIKFCLRLVTLYSTRIGQERQSPYIRMK